MNKKYISLLLALALVLTLFAGCGQTASKVPGDDGNTATEATDATETTEATEAAPEYSFTVRELREPVYITPAGDFAGGSGTEADPYQIADAAQLALMQTKLLEDGDYVSAYYVLTQDIALNDTADFANWSTAAPEYDWLPIGTDAYFKGILDGQGHTVSGMYINTNNEQHYSGYGLFSEVQGTVKNLILDKSYIAVSGESCYVGGIVGSLNDNALVENCTVSADFYCYDNTCGGIVGAVSGGSFEYKGEKSIYATTVSGCSFSGTITQVKEGSFSYLGGIAGASDGFIRNCVNNGTISFSGTNVDLVGGIAGQISNNSVTDCENKGDLLCQTTQEAALARVGGIAGLVHLMSLVDEDYRTDITVSGCVNSGAVSGQMFAGGILGAANNDHGKDAIYISDCVNSGDVSSVNNAGGIIGRMENTGSNAQGDSIHISGCSNSGALTGDIAGGIVSEFVSTKGNILVENCSNSGAATASGQHAAGIVAYGLIKTDIADSHIAVRNCENTAPISSGFSGGGIISILDMPIGEADGEVSVTVSDCKNSGSVTTSTINGGIGGIIGVLGTKAIPTTVRGCTNSGSLNITAMLSEEEASGTAEKIMTVSRIAGGIVGRIGAGLRLTVDNDDGQEKFINSENAYTVLENCHSTGSLILADDRESANAKNFLGGIVGYASGEKEFSILVKDCTYTGFDRGLGNEDFPDVGTKK